MERNVISVVIPSHHAHKTINKTLQSVYSSSLKVVVIAVEDGILDQTSDILNHYSDIIHLAHHPAKGASSARNLGLQQVSTQYVMFLDADDLICPRLLEHACVSLRDSEADLCLSSWSFHDQRKPYGAIKFPLNGLDNRARILQWLSNICYPPCSVVWRTESIRILGGWNEQISYNDDADLMLRALLAGYSVAVSQRGCGYYVQHHTPHRLSRSSADIADVSNRHLYQMVINELPGLSQPDAQQVLGEFCYEQVRRQYRAGRSQSAHDWLMRARQHGFKGHRGTLAHRVLVRLLGLPLKERLAGLRDSHPWLRHRFG